MGIIVNWVNYSALQVNNNNSPKHSATKWTGGYNVLTFLFDFYSMKSLNYVVISKLINSCIL